MRISTHPRVFERPLDIASALALEWGLELQSADGDFARYPGLRWRNPLAA